MVSPINPTVRSLNVLSEWKQGSEFLEVVTVRMSDGKTVRYLEKEAKPGLIQVLKNWVLNLFGKGVSWRLNNVANTLRERIEDLSQLDGDQQRVIVKFFTYIEGVNKRHKGKVSDTEIQTLKSLYDSKIKEKSITGEPAPEKKIEPIKQPPAVEGKAQKSEVVPKPLPQPPAPPVSSAKEAPKTPAASSQQNKPEKQLPREPGTAAPMQKPQGSERPLPPPVKKLPVQPIAGGASTAAQGSGIHPSAEQEVPSVISQAGTSQQKKLDIKHRPRGSASRKPPTRFVQGEGQTPALSGAEGPTAEAPSESSAPPVSSAEAPIEPSKPDVPQQPKKKPFGGVGFGMSQATLDATKLRKTGAQGPPKKP